MSQEVVRLEVCADMLMTEIRRTGQDLSNANASIRNLESLVKDMRSVIEIFNTCLTSVVDHAKDKNATYSEVLSRIETAVDVCNTKLEQLQESTQYDLGIPGNDQFDFSDPICRA